MNRFQAMGFALMVVALGLGGCSDASKVEAKARWLCKHNQLDKPRPDVVPEGEKLETYVRPEDLSYLEEKKDNSEGFAALGDALSEGLSPVARTMTEAAAEYTDCKVTDVTVEQSTAEANIERSVPKFEEGFKKLRELADLDSESERLARARKWYREADERKTKTRDLDFTETDEGWRANYHLERRDLKEERGKIQEKLESARADLQKVVERQKEAEKAREQLRKFRVHKASLEQPRNRFTGRIEPTIDLTVENQTGQAISRAYFRGVVASPDREVPWIEERFNYEVPGGVEPGERVRWSLAPNMFSAWGETEVPDEADLEVTVTALDGPDSETLYELPREDLEKRRSELEQKVERLEWKIEEYDKKLESL